MIRPFRARHGRARATSGIVALVSLGLVLTACSQESGATSPDDVVGQGYVSGDGSVKTWDVSDRDEPVVLTGTDFEGGAVDTSQWLGDVVVVNTWYASCAPCRAEAPDLVALANDRAAEGVHLLGINSTDDAGAALAFERTFEVPYPSIEDTRGEAIATLEGAVPLQAVPTTVVLDREGRVAARVIGRAEGSTLGALVDDLLAESA
ncbi:TlpA family protein disulfide reductase [Oerskovia turbata]|uniref:TlpA family protein disulfide reductase n=1 Tax=Oerskovia turbata TaxID=1713 RepID=A0A4Q1KTD0_9CELL|nr:TlpA disulfide reductase family protein [Oerskovia turbata]RXR23600.1 TlpA family protein disulfide reductase [Oerskovia turbata]RXR32870.1 TlpA family protein disulfide reductase [Oerskovia turbata]TGJ95171.1 TlpA family protein disulfide reductase [Actinotalea fermentans ATCC 43279 = JCM 9966 = DSM 3133]